jgi:hypothetical protein
MDVLISPTNSTVEYVTAIKMESAIKVSEINFQGFLHWALSTFGRHLSHMQKSVVIIWSRLVFDPKREDPLYDELAQLLTKTHM